VKKAGRLPPRLTAQIGTALSRGINGAAVDEALMLARSLRLDELHRPLGRLFEPKSVALVSDLATDFGRVYAAGGVRAMKLGVEASS
jgi:hypothetical protein